MKLGFEKTPVLLCVNYDMQKSEPYRVDTTVFEHQGLEWRNRGMDEGIVKMEFY